MEQKKDNTILSVKNLVVEYTSEKDIVQAVNDVSFDLQYGGTIGLVGETDAGKTTIAKAICRILPVPPSRVKGGEIFFEGQDVIKLSEEEMRMLRGAKVSMIFQDPYSSLNPRLTVEETVQEPLKIAHNYSKAQLEEETNKLMALVGIDRRMRKAYPHELDGSRRQRVGIARALAVNPKFIVCDEPVSALDVSIQAQILNLLRDLQKQIGLSYMFVTHDLSVVRHISDDICVMYLGQLVETSESKELFKSPLHPYTKALLSAIPSMDIDNPQQRIALKGEIVSPIDPKPGCRFAARCPYASEECNQPQVLEEVLPRHFVSCCKVRQINNL